jgi:hypothetical protein
MPSCRQASRIAKLRHIRPNPPCLVAGERPGRCARIIEMHIGELLAFAVADDEGRATRRFGLLPSPTSAQY